MAPDDLNTPLSRPAARRSSRWRLPLLPIVTLALAALVVSAVSWTMLMDDPLGGEPMATTLIIKPEPKAEEPPAAAKSAASTTGERTVTIIDGKSGARTQVPVGGNPDGGPAGPGSSLDRRLMEDSPHGPIPRVASDGARPLDVYARTDVVASARKSPHIAIVIAGLGISATTTGDALAKLPRTFTLAFAPHTAELTGWISKARNAGHEILLQLPMEPFDFPHNDPGPQTLLTSLSQRENIDRLHWFLSRAHGYVGVANFMGARFTSNEAALQPVLSELGRRGLLYLDDGTSTRSIAPKVADAVKAPFVKADIVIDAKANWSDIDTALERLERLAQERNFAVGFASALPVSIERIARWAKGIEARGLRIVPLSTIAVRPRES